MTITYDDIKHRLQPPLDCAEIKDLRGEYIHYRAIINYENTNFKGCVLYHCYHTGDIPGAIDVDPAQSKDDVGLVGVNLTLSEPEIKISAQNFIDIVLKDSTFELSESYGFHICRFIRSDLTGSRIFAVYGQCTFVQCDMRHVMFLDDSNISSDFTDCDLKGARFVGCKFDGCEFRNCNFENAVFDRCIAVEGYFDIPKNLTPTQAASIKMISGDEAQKGNHPFDYWR